MIVRITKSNYTFQFILLTASILALWIKNLWNPAPPILFSGKDFLYPILFESLCSHPLLSMLTAFFLLLFQTFFLNHILSSHSISKNPIFAVSLFFLLCSYSNNMQTLSPMLIANTFLLGSIQAALKIYDEKSPYQHTFDASALLAIASFFHPPLLFLFPILWLIFLVYAVNKWREWAICFFGFIFPYAALWLILYISNLSSIWQSFYFQIVKEDFFNPDFLQTSTLVFILFFSFCMLLSLFFVNNRMLDVELAQRKKIWTMQLFFIGSFILFVFSNHSLSESLILLPTGAFLMSEYFYRSKSMLVSEILFGAWLLLILTQNFIPIF